MAISVNNISLDSLYKLFKNLQQKVNFLLGGYKVYTALLSQSGISAPVATVLENTLGGNVVWSYNDVGDYRGTLAGAFPIAKTISPQFSNTSTSNLQLVSDNTVGYYQVYAKTEDSIGVSWYSDTSFTPVEQHSVIGNGGKILVEIRVYP